MKLANELKPGDKVVTLDGKVHTIRNVSRGMYTNSVMLQWSGGWSCVPNDTIIESPEEVAAREATK